MPWQAEQHNRIDDPGCQAIREQFDAELTRQFLSSITKAHAEKNHGTDWEDPVFAKGDGGWNRVYPQPIG